MPIEASFAEAIGAPPSRARRVSLVVHGARRPLDKLVLSLYVMPMEWASPMEDAPALDQETTGAH